MRLLFHFNSLSLHPMPHKLNCVCSYKHLSCQPNNEACRVQGGLKSKNAFEWYIRVQWVKSRVANIIHKCFEFKFEVFMLRLIPKHANTKATFRKIWHLHPLTNTIEVKTTLPITSTSKTHPKHIIDMLWLGQEMTKCVSWHHPASLHWAHFCYKRLRSPEELLLLLYTIPAMASRHLTWVNSLKFRSRVRMQ